MEQNLDTKLTRIENTISLMKTNLQLSENEVIEKVAEATNLHTLSNVFIQPDEPDTKDGIWIQTDKLYPYDNIIVDDEIIVPYKWQVPAVKTPIKGIYNSSSKGNLTISNGASVVIIDGMLYIYANGGLVKYDLKTQSSGANYVNTYASSYYASKPLTTDGQYIYYFNTISSNSNMMRYNVETSTSEVAGRPSTGYGFSEIAYSAFDDLIYMRDSYTIYAYSVAENAHKRVWSYHNIPCSSYGTKILPLGDKILVMSSNNQSFLIDIVNNYTITQTPEAVKKVKASSTASVVDMGEYFYVFEGLTSVTKYNKTTFEQEDVTSLFADENAEPIYNIFRYNDEFYSFMGPATKEVYLCRMETTGTQYDSNAVVVVQAPISKGEYNVSLWTYPFIKGGLKQSFYDAFYYNIEEGLKKGYPTYYGNGENWIKFKN
jgi:hypothetical protein